MDNQVSKTIYDWIEQNLLDCENPRAFGKELTADWRGRWRYRVGDYRIVAEIFDETIVIHIIDIGHRKDIYK